MNLYLIYAFVLLLFSLVEIRNARKTKAMRVCWIAVCVALVLLSGLRYGLETDYWHYYEMFNGITVVAATEPLFTVLMLVIRTVFKDFNFFVLFVAIMSMGAKEKLFGKLDYCFTAALFYYLRYYVLFELNAIRQGLAVSIVLFAIYEYLKGDNRKFVILSIIATLIHASSVVVFVIPVIGKKKIRWKNVVVVCCTSLLVRIFLIEKVAFLGTKYVNLIFNSSNNLVSGLKYILYNNLISNVDFISVLRVLIPTICLYRLGVSRNNNEKGKRDYQVLYNIYLVGTSLNLTFLGYDTISYRLASVFYCVEGMLVALSLNRKKVYSIRRLNLERTICYLSLFACDLWSFVGLLSSSTTLIPYKTFLYH